MYCLEMVKGSKANCQQTSKVTYHCSSGSAINLITPSSREAYFPDRRAANLQAISWRHALDNVSPPYNIFAIRRLFLSNLYGQTTASGSYTIPPVP